LLDFKQAVEHVSCCLLKGSCHHSLKLVVVVETNLLEANRICCKSTHFFDCTLLVDMAEWVATAVAVHVPQWQLDLEARGKTGCPTVRSYTWQLFWTCLWIPLIEAILQTLMKRCVTEKIRLNSTSTLFFYLQDLY